MLEPARPTSGCVAQGRAPATLVLAMDGTILRANAGFLALFGYAAREIVGLHHEIFSPLHAITGRDADGVWAELRRGEAQVADHLWVRKDGSEVWIEASFIPHLDGAGRPFEILTVLRDVSARVARSLRDQGHLAAIGASLAVVDYALDGTVTDVNARFLEILGYARTDVIGRHDRMFVDPAEAASPGYAAFWADLASGRPCTGEFKRFGAGGREVRLQASFHPVADHRGCPVAVASHAVDVTRDRLLQADLAGQIAAIHKSHGVITFAMDGTVMTANAHFLDAMGYRLDEIEGRHHRMFVEPSYAHDGEYAAFWDDLAQGRHQSGEYKRIGKDGRAVWLQATYNPVFDLNGRPFKVVKYATVVTRAKLRQADHQGQIASIHKAQCVVSFTLDGTILDANDNYLAATGYRLAEVRGRHHRIFVDDATAASADYAAFWRDLAKGTHRAAEFKRVCKDGREIWLQASYNPIFDMNGRPFKVVKYATDVTEDRLRQADDQGQVAAIRKSQCVVDFDMDGMVLDANATFLATMGYRLEEVVGRHHRMFVEPDVASTAAYDAFWATLRSGAFVSAKSQRLGKGGREIWLQASYNPILDLNGRPFKVVEIATDVTAEVVLAADLTTAKTQAEHDTTTALPNRVRLARYLAHILARPGARVAVLYLDLDHFKPINDTFGHAVGDRVLTETAGRLRHAVRDGQIVARIGGDEFAVAAPDLSDQEIDHLCRRLIAAVTAPIRHEKGTLTVGLSIGVAVSPHDATTPDDLLRCADVALYRSKGLGRGLYSFFAKDTNDRLAADRHLAEEMRHGVKAGQFFVDYQPRYDARTRALVGVAALVRWTHPERGRIEPDAFVALGERSGLIVPLGEFTLRTACRAALAWADLVVAVDVSPVQFISTDFTELVATVLSETGLAPERLELDLTEDVLADDEARAEAALGALKRLGVRLVMNGVDTSRVSLDDLRRFSFDVLKIDRRFVADIEAQQGGRMVVQAVLGLAKLLAAATAENGIEPVGHALRLDLRGEPEVHGFLLTKPVAAADVAALLRPGGAPLAVTG